jgi:hypothetical protein
LHPASATQPIVSETESPAAIAVRTG